MAERTELAVPVEIRVGDTSAEIATMTISTDPQQWRPRLAALLHQVADEIAREVPDG